MSSNGESEGAAFDVSWNLFNNEEAQRYGSQSSRLKAAADQLSRLNNDNEISSLFVSEGVSSESVRDLSAVVGLCVVGKPYHYNPAGTPDEVMAFAVPAADAASAEVIYIPCGTERTKDYGFLMLLTTRITRIGIQQPHRWQKDEKARMRIIERVIEVSRSSEFSSPSVPIIVEGDFNAQPHYDTRQMLVKDGFKDMFAGNYPNYPNPGFESVGSLRKIGLLRKFLHLSFDGMYSKGLTDAVASWEPSTASDHPLLLLSHGVRAYRNIDSISKKETTI